MLLEEDVAIEYTKNKRILYGLFPSITVPSGILKEKRLAVSQDLTNNLNNISFFYSQIL